ncbi:MAG: Hsp70 family protein [Pseudomonadota bacterium]
MASALGIDFGTSNSNVAVAGHNGPHLLPIEGEAIDIPSAVFFDFARKERLYGRAAVQAYVNDEDGRFMKGLKSILGSDLMHQHTYLNSERITYAGIVAGFLKTLKTRAEDDLDQPFHTVLAGRPVHFVAAHPDNDADAQATLHNIYTQAGFATVEFQFEPIAAALDYERQVSGEETVLIADLGGGTSDFSIVRVSPERANHHDRSGDILATGGVRIGGTDLDHIISVDRVMPLLGLNSELRRDFASGTLTIPRHIFMALATWQHVHRLYDQATSREVRDYLRLSQSPHLLKRLQRVLDDRLGHQLILAVERAKIALTDDSETRMQLNDLEPGLTLDITRDEFNALIADTVASVGAAMAECITNSGTSRDKIDAIFFTGGTAAVPALRDALTAIVPNARVVDGDRFGSVGTGLAIEAQRRFGD